VSYLKNIDKKLLVVDEFTALKVKEEMIIPNYIYLSADRLILGLESEYSYSLSVSKSLFVRVKHMLENYEKARWTSAVNISCRIKF
jgi:hypothetical protein